jgi:8-oxo-dGTP pyrophosphatase MutT (NUDIX family)
MVKRKENPAQNKWWFVGGRVFKNESLECAARRKVQEEIGFTVENVKKIIGGHELFFKEDPYGHGNGTHSIVSCFLSDISIIHQIKLDQYQSSYKVFKKIQPDWNSYLKNCLKKVGFKDSN